LMDLAESLGIEIRRAPMSGDFSTHPGGSFIRLKGRSILFIDPSAAWNDQVAAAALALKGRKELDGMFLPPEIRDLIENTSQ